MVARNESPSDALARAQDKIREADEHRRLASELLAEREAVLRRTLHGSSHPNYRRARESDRESTTALAEVAERLGWAATLVQITRDHGDPDELEPARGRAWIWRRVLSWLRLR